MGGDGKDVEVGGGVEIGVAEFSPPGEGGPDVYFELGERGGVV